MQQNFTNYGNTCYLNSSLQCLLGLEPFYRDLLKVNPTMSFILPSLQALCQHWQQGKCDLVYGSLKQIRDIFIEHIDSSFNNYKHQDASEFLIKLLTKISENIMSTTKKYFQSLKTERTFIEENFEAKVAEIYDCGSCEKVRNGVQTNLIWYLPVVTSKEGEETSVQSLVEQMLSNQLCKCTYCEADNGRCRSKIISLPRILIIQLKRYNNEGDKLNDPVFVSPCLNFDDLVTDQCEPPLPARKSLDVGTMTDTWSHEDLEMEHARLLSIQQQVGTGKPRDEDEAAAMRSSLLETSYNCNTWGEHEWSMLESLPNDVKNAYRLVGVVNHLGMTANSGHYVAKVFRLDQNKWFSYNDKIVNESKNVYGETTQRNCYLLFYMHKAVFEEITKSTDTLINYGNCSPDQNGIHERPSI